MTSPRDPLASGTTWWEGEGHRIAGQLRDVSAVLVAGTDPERAARVALGIARAECALRHVALGDLVGDLAPLYAVAGGEDAFGLTDCLREGLPLNDIARPAPGLESLFILPAGSPPVGCEEILAHERWPRLVNGFAKAGALLILVVPLEAPGLDALGRAAGGAVLVDVAPDRARHFRVLATARAPEPARRAGRAPVERRRRFPTTAAIVAIIAVAAVAAGWSLRSRIVAAYHARFPNHAGQHTAPRAASRAGGTSQADESAAPAPEDTVRLTDPVNPADSSATTPFAVEVMAANTLTGANSFLSDHARSSLLSGATVSPGIVGGSTNVWYKVVVGAWHGPAGADSLLQALRHDGLVHGGDGRVVKVPYALVIADNLDRTQALSLHDSWLRRGFNSYLLVQSDGRIRLLAGAFETATQAAPLASALRAAGVAPVLAFRTGRTY